jgi:hypothetical protein
MSTISLLSCKRLKVERCYFVPYCLFFRFLVVSLSAEKKKNKDMTTVALNNLWTYLNGRSLKQKDREWLANKLLEPTEVDAETKRQQEFVKESLTRAINEVRAAKREGRQLTTLDDFIEELRAEEKV